MKGHAVSTIITCAPEYQLHVTGSCAFHEKFVSESAALSMSDVSACHMQL